MGLWRTWMVRIAGASAVAVAGVVALLAAVLVSFGGTGGAGTLGALTDLVQGPSDSVLSARPSRFVARDTLVPSPTPAAAAAPRRAPQALQVPPAATSAPDTAAPAAAPTRPRRPTPGTTPSDPVPPPPAGADPSPPVSPAAPKPPGVAGSLVGDLHRVTDGLPPIVAVPVGRVLDTVAGVCKTLACP